MVVDQLPCFTLYLESTPYITLSASFGYQFLHFRLAYSFTQLLLDATGGCASEPHYRLALAVVAGAYPLIHQRAPSPLPKNPILALDFGSAGLLSCLPKPTENKS